MGKNTPSGGAQAIAGGTQNASVDPQNDGNAAEPVRFKVVSAAKRDALDALADKDYAGWREGNAQNLPLESVAEKDLIATQKYVHRPKVEKEKKKWRKKGGFKKEPLVMKEGGKYYIRDGHHRSQAALEDGAPRIPVRVMELTPMAKKKSEKPRIAAEVPDDGAYAGTNNVKVKAGTRAPVKKDNPSVGDVHQTTAMGNSEGKRRKFSPVISSKTPKTKSVVKSPAWDLRIPIAKADESTNTLYGWSSVISENGTPVTDHQGDQIAPGELVKAMHEFMLSSRHGGVMHVSKNGETVKGGDIVECLIFTEEVQKALGINLGKVGAFIGYKVNDPEIWAMRDQFKAFSIGGSGTRVKIT